MGTLRNSVFLWRGRSLFLLLFCFAIGIASAQERTIKGKVTSTEEGPLPGVNIKLQGTLQGAVSDADGNYSIVVPGPEAVLEFSYISYTNQSITVGNQSTIDVVLAGTRLWVKLWSSGTVLKEEMRLPVLWPV
jgi:hypothetical protein